MQKAQMRAAAAYRKEEQKVKGKERASLSTLKAIGKGAPKSKVDGKDNRPSKKVTVTPGVNSLKSRHLPSRATG